MSLTSTDYIGIGVLITTAVSAIVNGITALRLKEVHTLVNSQSTAQQTLISTLQSKVADKDTQISDAKQTAAVLAATKVIP